MRKELVSRIRLNLSLSLCIYIAERVTGPVAGP